MDGIARILASKWFAVPVCALPAFFLFWEYSAALRDVAEASDGANVVPVRVSPMGEGNQSTTGDSVGVGGNMSSLAGAGKAPEYADFLFLVTEEEFKEATFGTLGTEHDETPGSAVRNAVGNQGGAVAAGGNRTEANATSGDSAGNDTDVDFSFTVSDDEFGRATEVLDLGEGESREEAIKRLAEQASEETLAGANLNERFIRKTGDVAIAFFIIVLCLTPIRRLAPSAKLASVRSGEWVAPGSRRLAARAKLASALNRHRRLLGLSTFFYACLHFTLYFDDGLNRLLNEWSLFYIQCGLASFLTMLALAVTSNKQAVRKLGGKRWKKLHRLLYLAVPLLFYHKGWTGKADLEQIREACVWFAPMLILQVARILKWRASIKKKQSK